jgi:HPt (histidine-containing phosphotransfer) domain-containing protein
MAGILAQARRRARACAPGPGMEKVLAGGGGCGYRRILPWPPCVPTGTARRPHAPWRAHAVTADTAPPPSVPRRFRASDVAVHVDMTVVGDVCVGVSLAGYREVLDGFLADRSGLQRALLDELDAGRTAQLHDLAHALKGATASIGLRALNDCARHIESAGEGFDAAACAAAAALLRERLALAGALLRRMGFASG